MKTITKTQKIKQIDRTHVQSVSIDFEDRLMIIMHNEEGIALSIDTWNALIKLTSEIFWENGNKLIITNEKL